MKKRLIVPMFLLLISVSTYAGDIPHPLECPPPDQPCPVNGGSNSTTPSTDPEPLPATESEEPSITDELVAAALSFGQTLVSLI